VYRISILLVLAFAWVACSSSSGEPDAAAPIDLAAPDLSTPSDLAMSLDGTVVSDELAARVMGSYAMKLTIASTLDIPIVGKMPSTSTLLALVEIARNGAGLKTTETNCHVTVSGGGVVTTTIPDALPRSLPPITADFRVVDNAGVVTWLRPETITPVGVHLSSPTDPLPTTSTDPRVWDQDADGQPGATIKLSGIISGDVYIVQRQRIYYSGTVAADNTITGTTFDSSDQQVIGASNPALNQNVPSTPDPTPAKNTIRYAKLTSAYTCDMLVADAATLFP
jgi:hypothetical protein